MHGVETILFLVVLGTVVAAFAGRLRVPAPSLLVIAGLVVALLPRFPPVHVPPEVVSLVVLPPLLYAASEELPWRDLLRGRRDGRPGGGTTSWSAILVSRIDRRPGCPAVIM